MAWHDDLNQGFALGGQAQPGSIEALRAYQQRQQQTKQPAQETNNGFASLIPTGGGIAGSLGGAAAGAGIGTLILPGVGTALGGLIGGIAGGAGGSALGKVGENAIENKDLGQGVGQEALMGGLFSAPPLRILKGAGAAAKVAAGLGKDVAGGVAKDTAAQAFSSALTAPGALTTAGATLRGEARGVGIGEQLNGIRIGPAKAAQLNQFLEKTVKVKGLSSDSQLQSIESFINKRNGELSQAIGDSNKALDQAGKDAIIQNLSTKFGADVIAPTPRQQAIVKDIADRISQSKDVKSLDALRKNIDKNINFARNSASPEPGTEQVLRLARREVTDAVASRVGAAKALKSDLSNAFDAQELMLKKAGITGGFARTNGSSIATVPIPGRIVQGAQTLAGRGLGVIGDPRVQTGARIAAGDALTSQPQAAQPAADSQYLGASQPGQPDQSQYLGSDLYQPPDQSQASQQDQGQQTPYSQQNLLYDLQRDPKNSAKYISYYQDLQKALTPQNSQASFSKPSAQLYSQATTGLQSINQLEQMLQQDPSLANKNATPGQDLPVVGGLVSSAAGTSSYRAAANNILNSIARINTGAAMPASEAAFYARTYLPQPGDPPEAQAQKIAALRQFFMPIANYKQYSNGQDTSLQDALLQAQGGQ